MTTAQDHQTYWKRCNSCKREIGFSTPYWVCSVSTCNRKRTGMAFCSVACWEMHLPMMRHREAYAVEERSPTRDQWLREQAEERAAGGISSNSSSDTSSRSSRDASSRAPAAGAVRRRVAVPAAEPAGAEDDELERDILVVASKLKKYIRARSGMNTSDSVMSVLSDHVRAICNQAIRTAAQDGRKTVLDRDVPHPDRSSDR